MTGASAAAAENSAGAGLSLPPADSGLTQVEAERRLAQRGPRTLQTSRSYGTIVRANTLTVFNLILAAFGVVTLAFGDARDALFLGIIVANSGIGIAQEVRAKRALDRLSLLVAPRARVRRDGTVRTIDVDQLVVGDLLLLEPGEQLTADGTLLAATDLRLDESMLSGESQAVRHQAGEQIRSGAFVVEGGGTVRVEAVGSDSYAAHVTGEARQFRHPRSPLERAVNRLLYMLVLLVLGLGAVLGYSLYHRHVSAGTAVSTSAAGVVTLVPEGLMLLVSLTYAAAAVRMSRRGVLAQQLNAIESLASVDTICIDKTGTLTESALRVVELLPERAGDDEPLRLALGAFAAAASTRNITLSAIAEACPAEPRRAIAEVPFSSRRRWSAVQLSEGSFYLGAPERLPVGSLAAAVDSHQRAGRRVLAVARGDADLDASPAEQPPAGLRPMGVVVLAEELRPGIADTVAFLMRQGIELKVLSGDAPATVAAIARDVGIPVNDVATGEEIPAEPERAREWIRAVTVVGRISPEGKRRIVQALQADGRYVAMVGDGVNDVPALKAARVAIAQGSGTQMARAVADLVLITGDFATIPPLVAEGRQALRNLQRVAKLYVTKSAFAAFLILTIGISSEAYPLLPRHLSLAAALTIGIPTFFLALAPSSGPWSPAGFVRSVTRFAVPGGFVIGTGVVAAYLFALHDLDRSVGDARTVALTTLMATGLYVVMALEAGGSLRRSALVTLMCALMAGIYVIALLIPASRTFFALGSLDAGLILTSILASAVAIGALALCGFSLRTGVTTRPA